MPPKNKLITIKIADKIHAEAKKITQKNGWKMGAYCEQAIAEKNKKSKKYEEQ